MKKLSVICALMFVLALIVPQAFATEFCKDFETSPASAPNSPKSFDENVPKNSASPTTPAWTMAPGGDGGN